MADDFISNLQSLTSNLEEIVFTRFATVIKKNDDRTVDCREDSGTVHKNIKHSNLFNFQVGDTVILGFVDNDLYEPVIVGTRDVDLGVPTTEEIDELITDLNTLTTDMTNLKNSLIRFNGELISFSADNHNLAENLSKLKENLKFVLDDVKILDAGLGEFYDVLESFGIDIDEFVETLMGLNIDLNILQGYLSDFSGTLEQFDAKLRNELDEETYNKLNEDMVKLIWSISQVRGRTTTVEGQARHLADEIGDDTGYDPSTTQPSNLKQWIKWIKWKVGDSNSGMIKDIEALEALIGDDTPGAETGIFADLVTANNHITTINNYIYGNGDAQHPASGSILYQINTLVNTDIPKILTDIYGKPDGTSSDYTANSLYGKLVYMENQLWGNGSSGSPSSDSILGRLGAISNNAGTGRLDLLDKQGGTLDTLDSRIKSITNTGGTGSLDVLESTVGDNNSGLVKKANDLDSSVSSLETTVGNNSSGLVKKANDLDSSLSSLETTVGDNSSGLVKKANDLDTAIGSNTSGFESGLYLLIKNATDSITNITNNIIGSNTQGHETGIYLLIKNATDSIATINSKIGSDTSGSESGLYLAIKNAMDNISSINTKIGSDTSGSETGIYALIKGAIDNITDINTKIGDDTSGSESGIYLSLKNLSDSISYAKSIMGTNDQYTGADTIWGRIRAYLTRLDNISNTSGTGALDVLEEEVGDVDLADNGTLSNQSLNSRRALLNLLNIVLTGSTVVWRENTSYSNATTQLSSLEIKGLVDTTKLNYIHITTSGSAQLYKRNSSNTGWAYVGNYTNEISALTGHCVGVCYSIDRFTVYTHGEPFDILLELKTNQFYEKSNGNWVATNDVTDYFEYIALYNVIDSKFALDTHTHTGWTEVDVKTSGIGSKITDSKFYVNSDLRICELYFKRTGITMSSTYESWGVIPSTYSPKEDLWVATNYSTTGGYIEKTDSSTNDYTHIYGNTTSNNTALVFHSMWHY